MGLDMYLERDKFLWTDWRNPQNNPREDGYEIRTKILNLGYWRKDANLHGYIVKTFADGGDNCQPIALDDLPHTVGFFSVKATARKSPTISGSSGLPLRGSARMSQVSPVGDRVEARSRNS